MDPADVPGGPAAFEVDFAEGQDLGETTPLPFSDEDTVDLDLTVAPVGGAFDGWATVRCEPGVVSSLGGIESDGDLVRLELAEGERAAFTVGVTLAYASARIWVVDEGKSPAGATPACSDGVDNDGDELVDEMQDPGCAAADDGSETGGSSIVGVSPEVRFENPRVADVQGDEASPLDGRAVTIDRGRMVVTAIATDGFHVTDVDPAAPAGGSNSLFVFNYHTPWGLRECDVVDDLAGIVGEFYGLTELSFPSWKVVDPGGRVRYPSSSAECPIPAPVELTSALVDDFWEMETLESALVRVAGGRIGDTFTDCDLDGDGFVAFEGPEADCSEACSADAECTELNTYYRYGQYAVVLDGCRGAACSKVWAVTRHVVDDFWADHHAGETISVLTGTLRHIFFLDPEWILEIRCPDDIVLDGAALPVYQACVPPYARGQHYDDN
jgi:hypothetical protein